MTAIEKMTGIGTSDLDESLRVWVTNYGKRYHRYKWCRYLDHCSGQITESQKYAEYRGKTACPDCYPR